MGKCPQRDGSNFLTLISPLYKEHFGKIIFSSFGYDCEFGWLATSQS
jgi:hypothetical protein